MITYYVIGGALLLLIIWFISTSNSLIRKRNHVENTFAGVDVQLKKRHDVIPNLVATVKSFADREKELLTNVTALRTKAIAPGLNTDQKIAAENELSNALGQLQIQMEAYPELKSNGNYLQLQRTLNETEEQISAARRTYNATINEYNNGVEVFPSSIVASMKNMKRKPSFEATTTERENIEVGKLL